MGRRQLERWFERYRSRGDIAALGRVFDEAAPELMKLGLHLVREPALAEDLVQSTFLVAIEEPGRWDGKRPLLPWLLGILANHAAKLRREEARRPDPERLPEPESLDPLREALRSELGDRLHAALDDLPDPYREVLRPHLIDGERAVDIAVGLDRAPGTVRMQLMRGLDLLRRALPTGLATGFAIGAVPGGLSAMRRAVLERAASSGVPLTAGIAVSPLVLGGVLVTSKHILAVAIAIVATAATWKLVSQSQDPLAPHALAGPEATLQHGSLSPLDTSLAAALPANALGKRAALEAPIQEPEPIPQPSWWLVGEARVPGEPGEIRPTVNVHSTQAFDKPLSTVVGIDGRYEVDLTELFLANRQPELLVSAHHERCMSFSSLLQVPADLAPTKPGERTEIIINFEMEFATGLEGRVVLPPGWESTNVRVALYPEAANGSPGSIVLLEREAEEDGRFGMRLREEGPLIVVASASGLLPAFTRVTIHEGVVVQLKDLVLVPGDFAIEGTLSLPFDTALDGCSISVVLAELENGEVMWDDPLPTWNGASFDLSRHLARTDAKGNFKIGGLRRGLYRLSVDSIPGFHRIVNGGGFDALAPSAGVAFAAQLSRVTIEVLHGGLPVPDSKVQIVDPPHWHDAYTQGDGRLIAAVASTRDYVLHANKEGYQSSSVDFPTAARGPDSEVTIELGDAAIATASLVLQPSYAGDEELPPIAVTLTALFDSPFDRIERTSHPVNGSYTLTDLHPGRYRVAIEPWEETFGPYYEGYTHYIPFEAELLPGQVARHPLPRELGGRLRITVEGFDSPDESSQCILTGPDGELDDMRFVSREYKDNVFSVGARTGATHLRGAAVAYPNLARGTYEVDLQVRGYEPIRQLFVIRPGETTEIKLQLRAL